MSQLLPFTNPATPEAKSPRVMVSGEGCTVTDAEGNTFLDAVAGLWCASLGFSDARLAEAASRQYATLPYYHSFMGRTAHVTQELAVKLTEKLPAGMTKVFFATSGSEAIDTAVKLTRFYQNARGKPDKKLFVSREGAYHGSGAASAALTGFGYCHKGWDLPGSQVLRTGRAHFFADREPGETETAFSKRRARELDTLIRQAGAERVAAFIGEPVMGSGGVIPPPEGYWTEIQEVLARHDVLLIADEIITGFGRTGTWFACDRYGIRPAMLSMAKQLTGAYFPMSALALEKGVAETIESGAEALGTLGHGFTYGGHPVGAAVALEAMRIYEEMGLPNHVDRLSGLLRAALERVAVHQLVADIRLVGLMAGVEFIERRGATVSLAREIGEEAERRGVLFRIIDNTLAISPPLTVTPAEIEHIGAVMAESIAAVAGKKAA